MWLILQGHTIIIAGFLCLKATHFVKFHFLFSSTWTDSVQRYRTFIESGVSCLFIKHGVMKTEDRKSRCWWWCLQHYITFTDLQVGGRPLYPVSHCHQAVVGNQCDATECERKDLPHLSPKLCFTWEVNFPAFAANTEPSRRSIRKWT